MKRKLRITLISAILIVLGWSSHWFGLNHYYFDFLMITATVFAGNQVALNAYNSIKRKKVSIDLLVIIAAIGALIIGEYWESAAVTFLFTFGSYLEAKTMGKTRNAIFELMELNPSKAKVIRDGQEVEIEADEVKVGETVIVKPGEKVPVDGKVTKGKSEVNQSSITGESKPVNKELDDEVFSGTINGKGYLEVQAEKVGSDTTFSKIIDLVEEAQEEKAPTEKLMEKFSKYYTPGIIVLSILIYLFTRNIRLSLTLLVIGCPGALVISTPISIVSGIGNAAKNGVLIKGGKKLEQAGNTDVVVFDKTGTLTQGEPAVTNIVSRELAEVELIKIAASAEKNSEHHLAKAIVDKFNNEEELLKVDKFQSITGKGVKSSIKGDKIIVGNKDLLRDYEVEIPEYILTKKREFNQDGKTSVLVARNNKCIGILAVFDPPRQKAADTIRTLKEKGIKKTIMLTGDSNKIAKTVSEELNIDEYRAELLPGEKVQEIKKIQSQGYNVAMVGDGINDAPSLAAADTGIAMGVAGTDVAIEAADIALMADNIEKLPFAIGLSKSTSKNIKQNISFAIIVVFTLLAGVLGQKVFLASGMFVHQASVILVTLNAMRLLNYNDNKLLKQFA